VVTRYLLEDVIVVNSGGELDFGYAPEPHPGPHKYFRIKELFLDQNGVLLKSLRLVFRALYDHTEPLNCSQSNCLFRRDQHSQQDDCLRNHHDMDSRASKHQLYLDSTTTRDIL